MQVKFTTVGVMDFVNVRYVIMFNTSGNGQEPYTNGYQNNYANYSFALVVGGNSTSIAQPVLIEYVGQPGPGGKTVVTPYQLPTSPQTLQLIPNSNGQNTQFTVLFARALFNGLFTPTPPPGGTSSPSPSPVPTATPTGAATPTPMPTAASQALWNINFFTTDTQGNPLDAPGIGGKSDTSFSFIAAVNAVFDQQFTVSPAAPQAPTASAQILTGEVSNNP